MAEPGEVDPPRSTVVTVSVIVPVYNVEKHLRECLDSLHAQSLADLEVIVVLDAPTDGSAEIAQGYDNDPRFRIVRHSTNQGLAAARNTGMEVATGDFVGFVDSDDFVRPDAYELLVRAAIAHDADIVSCGYVRITEDGEPESNHPFPMSGPATRTRSELVRAMERAHAETTLWFVWRNLYRRTMLENHGLRFEPALRTGEDTPFNLRAFYSASRWTRLDDSLYMYRHSPQGLTMSPHVPYLLECLQVAYYLKRATYTEFQAQSAVAEMRLYVVRNLFPRLLVNAVRHSDVRQSGVRIPVSVSL